MKSKKSSPVLLSKKLAITNKLVKHGKNKTCFATWMAKLKPFWQTVARKKEKSDFQLYASKEMKEGDDESSDKEFLPEENENKHSSMV